jgi:hypothetical protein
VSETLAALEAYKASSADGWTQVKDVVDKRFEGVPAQKRAKIVEQIKAAMERACHDRRRIYPPSMREVKR